MNKRQIEKVLKENGFKLVKTGKHETYEDNIGTKIQIPSSGKELNWRLEKMILLQIKKRQGTNYEFKLLQK